MEEKYLKFYNKFIRHSKTLINSGIGLSGALEEGKHGSNGNTGVYFWTDSICTPRKINKNVKRKRNPRAGIQRGIMPQTNLHNDRGVGFTL